MKKRNDLKDNNPKMSNITQKWVDLLMPYTANYSARLSGSELARKAKIPQQTASRILSNLAEKGLINYKLEGKNKVFYIGFGSSTARILLSMAESAKALRFAMHNKNVVVILNEMLKYTESIIVFGSYASGNSKKESDLDIVLLGKYSKKSVKQIKQKYNIEINEHYVSYREFENILKSKNPLSLEIMHNHIILGDVSKITEIFRSVAYGKK